MRPLSRLRKVTQKIHLYTVRDLAFSILSVGLLAGLSYKPLLEQYHQESDIPEDLAYLRSWGLFSHFTVRRGPPLSVDGNARTTLVVNGEMLTKYKNGRKLIGICFHHWAGANFRDEQGISKSAAYDIDSTSIEIVIPLNEVFVAEELKNPTSASYVLLAVPFPVKPEDFNTIRDAESLGAKIIARASSRENLINN